MRPMQVVSEARDYERNLGHSVLAKTDLGKQIEPAPKMHVSQRLLHVPTLSLAEEVIAVRANLEVNVEGL